MNQVIDRLAEIASLLPAHGISVDVFQAVYPSDLSPRHAKSVNLVLKMILDWYLGSVHSFNGKLAEKDKVLAKMDEVVSGKDKMIEEKDKRIGEKDEAITRLEESVDFVTALREIRKTEPGRIWGSVTRAQAWNRLKTEGRIETEQFIPMVNHPRRTILESKLSDLKPDSWGFELDMYPHIMKAIKGGLYEQMEDVLVVDTHQHNDFHADISVAEHDDGRLLYSLRYFLELKHPKVEPQTAEYCGQVLDYFHVVREKQPHRSRFVALLSNFSWTWAYVADYDTNGTKIHEYPCRTLADAVIYAETTSISQLKTTLPTLDGMLEPKFSVLAVGKHSFLLSVTKSPEVGVLTRTSSRRQTVKSVYCWKPPVRHRETKNHLKFVLKIMHDDSSLANEIKILKTFRDAACSHLPELVWTREGNKELGIAPIGEPVRPGESAAISRKIVRGMIEGLRYLHNLHIIHRDIRLSNLILKRTANDVNVVIIDYETAFAFDQGPREVEYAGGYICWPTRLLQTGMKLYVPSPADDLFASVLVVLHLLFPSRFDEFNAGEIQSDDEANQETLRILQTWKDIESSSVWGQFYQAARNEEYDNLLRMSDFFCHV